jgi:hypothetical protein
MLERLEERDCPSTLSLMGVSSLPSTKVVTVSGQVFNVQNPSGITVLLSGVVGGSAVTDANGMFSASLTASGLGTVYAATADGQYNISQRDILDQASSITGFYGSTVASDIYVFSGNVNGGYQGETVNFGGLKDLRGTSTTVDANGHFSFTVQLYPGIDDTGDATAQAVDVWGTTSNLATFWTTPD